MTAAEHTPRPDTTTIRYACPDLFCEFRFELHGGLADVRELADQVVRLHDQHVARAAVRRDADLAEMTRTALERSGRP